MVDIMGDVLREFLNGDTKATYSIRRADGYLDESPCQGDFYFSEFEDWGDPDKKAMSLVRGKTLDIGAGAGRHALYLENLGHEIHAIDLSLGAVAVMRRRRLKNVYQMDMWRLTFPQEYFETLLLMFNGLGLAGTPVKMKELLRYLKQYVSLGGRLIGTFTNPYQTDNANYLQQHESNRALGLPGGQVSIRLERNGEHEEWLDFILVSPEELSEITKNTGWRVAETMTFEKDNPFYTALLIREI